MSFEPKEGQSLRHINYWRIILRMRQQIAPGRFFLPRKNGMGKRPYIPIHLVLHLYTCTIAHTEYSYLYYIHLRYKTIFGETISTKRLGIVGRIRRTGKTPSHKNTMLANS